MDQRTIAHPLFPTNSRAGHEKGSCEATTLVRAPRKSAHSLPTKKTSQSPSLRLWRLSLAAALLLVYLFYGDIVRGVLSLLKDDRQEPRKIQHPLDAFEDPGNDFRPRFRYWIPDAYVSTDQVADDIAEAGARGAAGIEVVGFYQYGASAGDYAPVDWNVYGWGTPAWSEYLGHAC